MEAQRVKSDWSISESGITLKNWEVRTVKMPYSFNDLINDYKRKLIFPKAKIGYRIPRKRKKLVKKATILMHYGFKQDFVERRLGIKLKIIKL